MNNNNSAKQAVHDMIFYYLYSLIKDGVEDPKQVVATEIPKMINLSEEQLNYIKINSMQNNTLVDIINSSIDLIKSIEGLNSLEEEKLDIVINMLELIKKDALVSLEKVFNKENDNDRGN